MTTQPILIVYTDNTGTSRTEHAMTASFATAREEELEAAGYTIIH